MTQGIAPLETILGFGRTRNMRKPHKLTFHKTNPSNLEGYSNISSLWMTPTDAVVYYIAKRKVGRKLLRNQYLYDLIVEIPQRYDEGGWIRVGGFHNFESLDDAAEVAQQIEIDVSPYIVYPKNQYGGYDSAVVQPSVVERIISSMGGHVQTAGYR